MSSKEQIKGPIEPFDLLMPMYQQASKSGMYIDPAPHAHPPERANGVDEPSGMNFESCRSQDAAKEQDVVGQRPVAHAWLAPRASARLSVI
jgi:hypothetical protein